MAQELYIKAIEFAHNFDDYIDIAESIFMFDKEWAKDIYQNESDDDLKLDTSDSSSEIESIKIESTTDADQQSDELLQDNTKEHFEDLVNDDNQDENLEQQEYNEPTSEVDIENSLIEDDVEVTNDIHESISENKDDEEQQLIDNSDDVTIDENKDLNQLCEDQNNLSMLIMAIKDGKPITINCDNRDIVIDSSDLDIRGVIKEVFFNKWNNINESIKSSIQ